MKKTLALILALSLVLGAMSGIAFAAGETLGNADFDSNAGKTVFDGTNYYTTLNEALKAVHGTKGAVLYCKPDADVGSLTHGHVCKDLTVYGNGAYISGGEQDFEIDSPAASGTNCVGLTEAVTLKVDNLTGAGAWGTKKSAYAITLEFTNCENMGKIFYSGTAGELNIHMEDCSFNGNEVSACKVYTNTNGTITLDNVDFAGVDQPVALNNKSTGTQTIVLKDCAFTNCGAATADWTVPVSVKSSVSGGTSVLTVDNCTFVGTVENSIGQDADILLDYGVGTTTAAIVNTAAKIGTETAANDATYSETKTTDAVIVDNVTVVPAAPAARIGDNYYKTIQDAINAAKSGDSIKVYPGDHAPFVVTENVAISAVDDKIKPRIIITEIADGGVKYKAENVEIYNLTFVIDENATRTGGYYPAALGFHVEDNARRSYLKLSDCEFINNSDLYAIAVMAHIPSYDIEACKFVNFATGISTALDNGKAVDVSVTENTFEEVDEFISAYWGVANNGSVTILENKATDGSTTKINIQDYVKNTVGADATAFGDIDIKDNDAKVVFTNYDEDDYTSDLTGNKYVVYNYTSKTLLDALDVPEGTIYVNYGRDNEESYLVNEDGIFAAADSLKVEFALDSEDEGEMIYDINLVASASDIINRLNSVDLTFLFTQINGNNDFEIIASNPEVVINPVDNSTTRYEFHYNGKDNATTDTDTEITIGQVKFTGYGAFTFAVDTSAEANATNVAHATKFEDNIVDTFIPNGDVTAGEGKLDLTDSTTGNVTIAVPTRALTINVAFPNAVENKGIAYQDMKVVISGGDLAEEIEIDLGSDAVETALEVFGKEDAKYVATFANDAYKVIVTDVLTVNNAYTVTVSGAGYRTARYTVTMTEPKTLNFWNNVMDEEKVVEVGKDSSNAKVTFLAGDIVKDNNINIYDLSAVVSYFATSNETDKKSDYAKYDLNRDGVIDSKDVAYVLVSWNN